MRSKTKKAIILLSGGLDSSTCLYWAKSRGYNCHALAVSYGQRHDKEVAIARRIAKKAGAEFSHITLSLPWLDTSSLVNKKSKIPNTPLSKIGHEGIPSTYVPGRNLLFVSLAASLADSQGAQAIVVGANALDYSGYPDCRPEFYRALRLAAVRGTRFADGGSLKILTPLINLDKAHIVRLAKRLKVPLELTWSCYAGGKKPCGVCDSCKLRAAGFARAKTADPALK